MQSPTCPEASLVLGNFRKSASLLIRVLNIAFGLERCTGEAVWGEEDEWGKCTEISGVNGRIIFVDWR